MKLKPIKKLLPIACMRIAYCTNALPIISEHEVKRPIFITGCGRSGTTMLRRVIASHRDVSAFPTEAGDLWAPKGYPWRNSSLETPPRWADPLTFTQIELEGWEPSDSRKIKKVFRTFQALTGKKYFLNKSPAMALMIPHALELFPGARIINVCRDGRAVALSWAKREYSRMKMEPELYRKRGYLCSYEGLLEKTAESWKDHILTLDKQIAEHKLDEKGVYLELRYEDCCAAPDEQLSRSADFLGFDAQGFGKYPMSRSSNYKFKEDLDPGTIKKLTKIMEPALLAKGYTL